MIGRLCALLCRHTRTIICKYDGNGEHLPINQQYYRCVDCQKQLENLKYLIQE